MQNAMKATKAMKKAKAAEPAAKKKTKAAATAAKRDQSKATHKSQMLNFMVAIRYRVKANHGNIKTVFYTI